MDALLIQNTPTTPNQINDWNGSFNIVSSLTSVHKKELSIKLLLKKETASMHHTCLK
jgi:hypothetical protein